MQQIKSIGTNIWNDTENCFICGIRWFGAYHECELSPGNDLTIIRPTGRKKRNAISNMSNNNDRTTNRPPSPHL